MSDDLKQTAKPDAARINVEQEHDQAADRPVSECY